MVSDYLIEIEEEEAGYASQTIKVTDWGTIHAVKLLPTGWYHPINNYIVDQHYTFSYQKQHNSCSGDISETGPHIYAPAASSSWVEGYLEEPMHLEKWMTNMIVKYTGKGYALCVGLKEDLTASFTSASVSYTVYNNGGQATQRTNYTVIVPIRDAIARLYDNKEYYFTFRTAGSGQNNYKGNLTIHDLYFE